MTPTQVQILLSALERAKTAMKYAFEDHCDQYYLNVQDDIERALKEYRQSQSEQKSELEAGLLNALTELTEETDSSSSELIALTPLEHYLAVKQSGLKPKPLITQEEIEAAAHKNYHDTPYRCSLVHWVPIYKAGANFILEKLGVGLK